MKKVILFYFALATGIPRPQVTLANEQGSSIKQAWPCGDDTRLLADSVGNPVWISSEELKSHGINMPSPALPSSLRAAGRLTVDVKVDVNGRVTCSRMTNGHPLLKAAISEAVAKWTFRPFSAGGQPVAVYGHLEFVFGN